MSPLVISSPVMLFLDDPRVVECSVVYPLDFGSVIVVLCPKRFPSLGVRLSEFNLVLLSCLYVVTV